jgi:hypothetical protein
MLLPFKIEDITKINNIIIKLSQDNNFDISNKSITLSNIKLSFGYEKGSENINKSRLILGGNN